MNVKAMMENHYLVNTTVTTVSGMNQMLKLVGKSLMKNGTFAYFTTSQVTY